MDMDLKKDLIKKLTDIAPEYGLVELSYPSFMRCYGYKSQPLSAADAAEGVTALLDVAGGVRMEVEVEGARNGGEWFGGGRVWEAQGLERNPLMAKAPGEDGEKAPWLRPQPNSDPQGEAPNAQEATVDEPWWVKNFWTAYDALTE